MKTLRVLQVYVDYVLKGMFIEVLVTSIGHNVQAICSNHEYVQLPKLEYEENYLRILQAS